MVYSRKETASSSLNFLESEQNARNLLHYYESYSQYIQSGKKMKKGFSLT
ncbi:Uncharacterised protein [Sphingobacterium daejeonense]|nr:Uncharacterised protein [Sphingobacterium daejeonense]